MMVNIFVEGVADEKFLHDYLSHLKIDERSSLIIKTEGWTNLYAENTNGEFIRNQMKEKTDDGGINLLIFDADDNYPGRIEKLEEFKKKYDLLFEIYLWPNNLNNGDLEVVLENIINPSNKPIFDCWNSYETCLQSKTIVGRSTPLTTPARKTKIYGYLEALLDNSNKEKIKEKKRDYNNIDHWNLDAEYLSGLKSFIKTYLP